MMETKYGSYPSLPFSEYKKSLINRIWCLIPLREEKCTTINKNIERINRELIGFIDVAGDEQKYVITVIHLLENLADEKDFNVYRSDVLRCCELIGKIGGDDHV